MERTSSLQKDNKFIKLQPSEKKVYQFNAEKIEQVEAEFNGKKNQRYRYTVMDPDNGNNNQERYLEEREEKELRKT